MDSLVTHEQLDDALSKLEQKMEHHCEGRHKALWSAVEENRKRIKLLETHGSQAEDDDGY